MAAETLVGGVAILIVFLVLALIGIAVFAFVFWILMIVDAAQRKFSGNEQIMWVLIIVLTGIIGALIYYFIIKRNKK